MNPFVNGRFPLPSRSVDGADGLRVIAQVAAQLNAAIAKAEAYEAALRALASLVTCTSIRATESVGESTHRLRAILDRRDSREEFSYACESDPTPIKHTLIQHVIDTRGPLVVDQANQLKGNSLPAELICESAESFLCVPLVIGTQAIGLILASSIDAHPYSTTEVDHATTIAAMLASTLSRLELVDRAIHSDDGRIERVRHDDWLEKIGTLSQSAVDLDQIIQQAIDVLARTLPAGFIFIRMVTFGRPDTDLRAWVPGEDRRPRVLHAPLSQEERSVYADQRALYIEDLREARFAGPEIAPLVERLGARSLLIAPVIYRGQVLAGLGLIESDRTRQWSTEEQVQLSRVTASVAPLVLNSQLQARLRTYVADQLRLLRIAADVTNEMELDRALHAVLESCSKITGADANAVLRWDGESKLFRLAAARDLPPTLLERYTRGISSDEPVCSLAVKGRVGVTADLATEPRFAEIHAAVRWAGLRGMWATPVIGANNSVIGLLLAFSRGPVEVFADDQRLADLFARPAAIAISNVEMNRVYRLLTSQTKVMEEGLRRSEQYKTEFMAIISHELRTPLNAIIGYAQMLAEGFSGDLNSSQRADVRTIAESANRLLCMVEDTLDLARIDAQRFPVFIDSLAFDDVIERAIATVAQDADSKGLQIEAKIADDVPEFRTDPERVRQILTHLLSNAVKFSEKGSVTINIERDGNQGVQFRVTDTGIGFDTVAFPHIFDDLRQMDASTTRIYGGNGLGLAVAKRMVKCLGGTIGVKSTPGEGSTFWFSLPLEVPEQEFPKDQP